MHAFFETHATRKTIGEKIGETDEFYSGVKGRGQVARAKMGTVVR